MNVNEINQSFSNYYQNQIKQKINNSVNLQVSDSNSVYATMQQDDFASTIWNMTDSMPRANQISFTATVLANKMVNQGITDENRAFLKEVSNRFSPEEMNTLKAEISPRVTVSIFISLLLTALLKPLVFLRGMSRNEVKKYVHAALVSLLEKSEGILVCAVTRSDFLVIADIVACILER